MVFIGNYAIDNSVGINKDIDPKREQYHGFFVDNQSEVHFVGCYTANNIVPTADYPATLTTSSKPRPIIHNLGPYYGRQKHNIFLSPGYPALVSSEQDKGNPFKNLPGSDPYGETYIDGPTCRGFNLQKTTQTPDNFVSDSFNRSAWLVTSATVLASAYGPQFVAFATETRSVFWNLGTERRWFTSLQFSRTDTPVDTVIKIKLPIQIPVPNGLFTAGSTQSKYKFPVVVSSTVTENSVPVVKAPETVYGYLTNESGVWHLAVPAPSYGWSTVASSITNHMDFDISWF